VRRILDFEVEFIKARGVAANGSSPQPAGLVVFGGPDTTAYIVDRAAATGEAYLPEQIDAVVETQLRYLRAIGAIGPPDLHPQDFGGESPPT